MKLIDILPIIDKHTKIKLFIDDKKTGIPYISPLSSALKQKYNFQILDVSVRNNMLFILLML